MCKCYRTHMFCHGGLADVRVKQDCYCKVEKQEAKEVTPQARW